MLDLIAQARWGSTKHHHDQVSLMPKCLRRCLWIQSLITNSRPNKPKNTTGVATDMSAFHLANESLLLGSGKQTTNAHGQRHCWPCPTGCSWQQGLCWQLLTEYGLQKWQWLCMPHVVNSELLSTSCRGHHVLSSGQCAGRGRLYLACEQYHAGATSTWPVVNAMQGLPLPEL